MSSDEDTNIEPILDRFSGNKPGCSGARSKNSGPKLFKINAGKKCSAKQPLRKNSVWMARTTEIPDKNLLSVESPSPYFSGSKKRQNGDKNEALAKSKRTCLSNRLFSDWTNGRKKKKFFDHPSPNRTSDETCGFSEIAPTSSDNPHMKFMEEDISPDEIYEKRSGTSTLSSETDGASSSLASSSNSNNHKNQKRNFCTVDLSQGNEAVNQPSTSKSQGTAVGNNYHHQLSDSDSEDFLNRLHFNMRKSKNKETRKIFHSDDSNDSTTTTYRHNKLYRQPHDNNLLFESDDSSDLPRRTRKKYLPRLISSSDSNDDQPPNSISKNGPANNSSKKIALQPSSKFLRFKTLLGEHSYANSEQNGAKEVSVNLPSGSSDVGATANTTTITTTNPVPVPLRSRYPRRDCSGRQNNSPHFRAVRCRRHSGPQRQNVSQSRLLQRENQGERLFSEFFEGDDSSEVEFFTAHSYSDTETSADSMCALESSTLRNPYRATAIPEAPAIIVDESSDDDISVVFSGNSCFAESSGRARHRGPVGRQRRSRGTVRSPVSNPEEVCSASPDPVEQVRQVEEDEQFARMLQAEFDAEVTHVPEDASAEDNNEDCVIDPFANTMQNGFSGSVPPHNNPSNVSVSVSPRNMHINIRARARFGTPSNVVLLSGGGRRRRGRRNFPVPHGDPWMWQFARILGLGPTHYSQDSEDGDYETLLRLAESVGEVIPRGLRKAEINRLPTRKYFAPGMAPSAREGHDDIVHKRTELNKECQVCLCDYENGDVLRILPCFHEFHTPCIDPWLKINHTCPVCRVEVVLSD